MGRLDQRLTSSLPLQVPRETLLGLFFFAFRNVERMTKEEAICVNPARQLYLSDPILGNVSQGDRLC